jgi:hypothetical protein
MEYYIFCGHRLARGKALSKFEWLVNGEWEENAQMTLSLNDAIMDYGDYSVSDQDHIKPEIAEELIQTGKTVLQGDVGFGTFYHEPTTIKLSNWKKPSL